MPCQGPVHLRRAVVDDAAGIAEVHVSGWQRSHAGLVPADYIECIRPKQREAFWRGEIEVEADDRKPWVALVDDHVVGFASAGISRDADADASTGEVYLIYVDPECWGRGIGSNLLKHVLRDLRDHGFERAHFWAVAGNAAARAFAAKHGWVADGATRFEECRDTMVEQARFIHDLR